MVFIEDKVMTAEFSWYLRELISGLFHAWHSKSTSTDLFLHCLLGEDPKNYRNPLLLSKQSHLAFQQNKRSSPIIRIQ